MSPFSKYTTEVLLVAHKNLEKGIQNAIDLFIKGGPKAGYAPTSYHVSLGLLAQVEDELYERGVDPHNRKKDKK